MLYEIKEYRIASSENSNIFIWKAFSEWKSTLEDMYRDILTPELKAEVKKNRSIVKYCDDPTLFKELSCYSIDSMITTEKILEFRQCYSHIRVYHACRPRDMQSYYEKGILPSSELKDVQVDRFREIFLSGDFPELTEEMLQHSIKEVAPYSSDEDLCFAIEDRTIIEHSGHYLIYGIEYLTALAVNLPVENSKQYLSVLRGIGKPTFLEINLPNVTEHVSDYIIGVVIRRMITEWVYNISHSRAESCLFDCTLSFNKPQQQKHICSHYHPRKITDPQTERKIYDTETGEYEDSL